jgi:major membrane immunogen (membrane-anchored lipoprotein)
MGSKMSLTMANLKESAKSMSAALVTAAFMIPAANAQGTETPVIEPSTSNLSQPLREVCVATTPGQPGLTAWEKLSTIMGARGQMIAAEGNQIVAVSNARQGKLITVSNNFSGKEGYIVSSEVPYANRKEAPSFCLKPASFAFAVNMKEEQGVPKVVNKGELGVALTNHDQAGSKTAIAGMYPQGTLFAVHFNPRTHKGAIKIADAQGGKAGDLAALEDFDYSDKMKRVFELASLEKNNNKPSVVAANSLPQRAP